MAVTEVIHFLIQAQLATRRWFLARIHTEPTCEASSLSWNLTFIDVPNRLVPVRLYSPQTNAPLETEAEP